MYTLTYMLLLTSIYKNVHKHRFSIKSFVQTYVVTFIEQGNVCVPLGTSHFANI